MVTGRGEIKLEGFALALLGFFLSRLAVAESIMVADTLPFLLSELPSLLFGLGLALSGVVLAVGPASRAYVRTVTAWALLGTVVMALAISLTVLGVALRGESAVDMLISNMLVANVVLAGAIGGAFIGDRSAKNHHYRAEIQRQVDRAQFINRLLRHEVLNAVHIIQGYAGLGVDTDASRSSEVIRDAAFRIDETIGDVGDLADDRPEALAPVDLVPVVAAEAARADGVSTSLPPSAFVLADHRLRWVIAELIEHAVNYDQESEGVGEGVNVVVQADTDVVELRVEEHGAALPESAIRLLERGVFPDFDDPTTGFGIQTVRLLVVAYGGDITVDRTDGTAITVYLPRTNPAGLPVSGVRARSDELAVAAGAAVLAGIGMGVYLQLSTGLLPVIGSLYGTDSAVVGWVTHIFHSLVFGVLFAAAVVRPPLDRFSGRVGLTLLGIGWGVMLWLVAAGVIMPLWLHLIGVETILPNLTRPGLLAHALWGGVLGLLYSSVTVGAGVSSPIHAFGRFRESNIDR